MNKTFLSRSHVLIFADSGETGTNDRDEIFPDGGWEGSWAWLLGLTEDGNCFLFSLPLLFYGFQ